MGIQTVFWIFSTFLLSGSHAFFASVPGPTSYVARVPCPPIDTIHDRFLALAAISPVRVSFRARDIPREFIDTNVFFEHFSCAFFSHAGETGVLLSLSDIARYAQAIIDSSRGPTKLAPTMCALSSRVNTACETTVRETLSRETPSRLNTACEPPSHGIMSRESPFREISSRETNRFCLTRHYLQFLCFVFCRFLSHFSERSILYDLAMFYVNFSHLPIEELFSIFDHMSFQLSEYLSQYHINNATSFFMWLRTHWWLVPVALFSIVVSYMKWKKQHGWYPRPGTRAGAFTNAAKKSLVF